METIALSREPDPFTGGVSSGDWRPQLLSKSETLPQVGCIVETIIVLSRESDPSTNGVSIGDHAFI